MAEELFVPEDFAVPDGLTAGPFRLAPLGPQHNEADHAAWVSSIDHIRSTPGFPNGRWPHEMSLSDNLRDLERHARDFAERRGFTYTVLSADTGDVIGCVYIYPARADEPGENVTAGRHAQVRSWVRADRAALDAALYSQVRAWLERDWPFDSITYAPRT
jgi:hypothetical protein